MINKIIHSRQRKKMVYFYLKSIEEIGKYMAEKKYQWEVYAKRIIAAKTPTYPKNIYIVTRMPKMENTLLIFFPDAFVLEIIKRFETIQVTINAFSRH